jgi:predicted DNA-binding ribbon-helix-helix protein
MKSMLAKSMVVKRSILFGGRKTSVSLEDAFWQSLHAIARSRGISVAHLVELVDACRQQSNLSSALRLFVLSVYRDQQVPFDRTQSKPTSRRPIAAAAGSSAAPSQPSADS